MCKLNTKSQSGVVLVVGLIIMSILTIIGINAVQMTILEERMAGNYRDQNLAFQAAESALSEAENSLTPTPPAVLPAFTDAGTGGFYSSSTSISLTDTELKKDSFWTSKPVAESPVNNLGNKIPAPQYIIQKLPVQCYKEPACATPSDFSQPYRITVRATGATTTTIVILQSVFTP